jgi:hypothetical protein
MRGERGGLKGSGNPHIGLPEECECALSREEVSELANPPGKMPGPSPKGGYKTEVMGSEAKD